MKRLTAKIMTIAACAAMMLSVGPLANTQTVQAAVKAQGTVNLATATKKLTIPKGKSTVITNNTLTVVKGRRYDVKFKAAGKTYKLSTLPTTVGKAKVNTTSIASIKNNLLTANKAGTTTFRIIKGGKDLVKLKVKVIDTAAHKHAWKNITKATCASKGKKLCKTCGATGTTAMLKNHTFEVTKKATCKTKGVETCTTCGLQNTLPKTSHNYKTDVWKMVEHRGKAFSAYTSFCSGCDADMTNWTKEQITHHRYDDNHFECFMQAIHGVAGETRYPEYVKVEITDVMCENCGVRKGEELVKDLYRCDKYGNKIPDGETAWSVYDFDNYCDEHRVAKFLCEKKHPASTAKKAAAKKAVAAPQDIITDVPDNSESFEATDIIVSDNATVSENTVSENTISDNEVVIDGVIIDTTDSEQNTDITGQETGGDVVLEDQDDEGIIIEDIDETNEEDNGTDDYDDSEGIVIEDE